MIVPTMSYIEMYDALVADSERINFRIQKIKPKAIKELKKSRYLPAWHIDEYKIPSTNNQYVLFFYAENLAEIEDPKCVTYGVVFSGHQRFVIRGISSSYKHTPQSQIIDLPQIHAYTSHFLQRYNERFLHQDGLSANEIAGLFFVRNRLLMPIEMNEEINRNIDKYDNYKLMGIRIYDGFCFVKYRMEGHYKNSNAGIEEEVESMFILYASYMNTSDMSESQNEAIEKECAEVLKNCNEFIKSKCLA